MLPFQNLSDDKEKRLFCLWHQDEILTRLAKIGALKVICVLDEAYESNRKCAGRSRCNSAWRIFWKAACSGSAMWCESCEVDSRRHRRAYLGAESYNRKLDDNFAVESEVAGAIAEALNAS